MPWTSAKNLIKSLGSGASMYVINSKNEENAVYNELVNRGMQEPQTTIFGWALGK